MARLTELQKQEMLEMANSAELREDFRIMAANKRPLSPNEWVAFATFTSSLCTEKASDRPLIKGDMFIL